MSSARPSKRFLRSKRERALLWYAAEGRCQYCGDPLPESWHADHRTPWRLTQDTNIHEMVASCPRCNLRKGGMMIRSFQRDFEQRVKDLLLGVTPHRTFFCAVTPGGGKSSLPLLLARLLPRLAEKLCWVVPRVTLASQAEAAFTSKRLKALFPHTCRIRHDTNTPNPARDLQGYVTTYNAIAAAPTLHAQEFARQRYILFLDEPHHLKTHFEHPEHAEFAWSHAIAPLIERAALIFYASGTFERHDQKPIFGLPYVPAVDGFTLALPPEQTIRYRRQQALYEKAIVPLHFIVRDGTAIWRDIKGERIERESFDETSFEGGQMLEAALETDFAKQLLADTVGHWQGHRQHFPQAKLLVVAPRIALARRYAHWLTADHQLTVRLATSSDAKDAPEAIDAFKGRKQPTVDVLVTVGMAYEGLDVPEISHVACLTRYRSRPWLEQCFARACRIADGKQAGYIFAPDDPLLNQVVDAIRDEQDAMAKDKAFTEPGSCLPGSPGTVEFDPKIIPLSSRATESRAYDFHQSMTREETARYALLMQQQGILGVSPLQLKRLIDALEVATPPAPPSERDTDDLTPSEIEARYRKRIDDYTRAVDFAYFDGAWGSTNLDILKNGFPPREGMTQDQLHACWAWVQERYPLGPLSEEDAI